MTGWPHLIQKELQCLLINMTESQRTFLISNTQKYSLMYQIEASIFKQKKIHPHLGNICNRKTHQREEWEHQSIFFTAQVCLCKVAATLESGNPGQNRLPSQPELPGAIYLQPQVSLEENKELSSQIRITSHRWAVYSFTLMGPGNSKVFIQRCRLAPKTWFIKLGESQKHQGRRHSFWERLVPIAATPCALL